MKVVWNGASLQYFSTFTISSVIFLVTTKVIVPASYIWAQTVLNFSVSFLWMRVLKNCYIKVGGSVLLKEKRQSNSVRCMFNIIYNGSQHDGKVRLCKLTFLFFRFVIPISVYRRMFEKSFKHACLNFLFLYRYNFKANWLERNFNVFMKTISSLFYPRSIKISHIKINCFMIKIKFYFLITLFISFFIYTTILWMELLSILYISLYHRRLQD